MSEGHRKGHHAHETTDAYAEGWDARERVGPQLMLKRNPYRTELAILIAAKPRTLARQVKAYEHNADLWEQGWADYGDDEANPES